MSYSKIRGWLYLFIWMGLIFWFSAQPGNESSAGSQRILSFFLQLGIDLKAIFGSSAVLVVRKTAHFSEYFILSLFLQHLCTLYQHPVRWLPWFLATAFACTDELHQAFVPGRGPAVLDVVIDSCGALSANIIALWNQKHR